MSQRQVNTGVTDTGKHRCKRERQVYIEKFVHIGNIGVISLTVMYETRLTVDRSNVRD